ncbi:protein slit-like [Anneissia japonica]|uniref:protein slit-like n=1 Tax=Anneissia japonica TaxID=1529436 RepID=UPI001425AF53|nr:protein slit-like [Anneissia japonica]
MTHGLMAALMKMECYQYLICFALFASFNCTFQFTYNYDPSISGTYPPRDLRCPKECNCTYVAKGGSKYRNDVYCSHLTLKNIPSKNTVPTDVAFYFLNDNQIQSLKNNSFNIFSVLDFLDLQYNQLKSKDIERDAFRGLRKLTYLAINDNYQLSELQAAWFVDLVSLEHLHLQRCGINILESDVFKPCKHLNKVNLANNNILSFPTGIFQNMSSLVYLYIGNNRIIKLQNQAFVRSNRIQVIDVSNNGLTTINENVGLQNLSQLQRLNVAYNRFSCDCNLVWFRNWINKTNVTLDKFVHMQCYRKHGKSEKLLDFDPDTLQCSKLIKVLRITIPSVSAGVVIVIIGSLLYYYRYDLR